jgi:hypothetical protein
MYIYVCVSVRLCVCRTDVVEAADAWPHVLEGEALREDLLVPPTGHVVDLLEGPHTRTHKRGRLGALFAEGRGRGGRVVRVMDRCDWGYEV